MHLQLMDWLIVAFTLGICFVPALFFGKRGRENTAEFFASGRSVPWWLAGLSMVATTFSSDTPNWIMQPVRQYGVAGNWQWWAFVLTGVSTVFFVARRWRRSDVMTDLEFYELRYSGRAASEELLTGKTDGWKTFDDDLAKYAGQCVAIKARCGAGNRGSGRPIRPNPGCGDGPR